MKKIINDQEDIGYRLWYPHGFVYCQNAINL